MAGESFSDSNFPFLFFFFFLAPSSASGRGGAAIRLRSAAFKAARTTAGLFDSSSASRPLTTPVQHQQRADSIAAITVGPAILLAPRCGTAAPGGRESCPGLRPGSSA